MNFAQRGLMLVIRLYQRTVSPVLLVVFGPSGCCRFTPSCSQYAIEAIGRHGVVKGSWLGARRLCRCHPWGGSGEDLPPPAEGVKKINPPLNFRKHGHCHG